MPKNLETRVKNDAVKETFFTRVDGTLASLEYDPLLNGFSIIVQYFTSVLELAS